MIINVVESRNSSLLLYMLVSKVTSKVGSLDNVRKSSRSGNGDEKSSASGQMEGPKKPSKRISQHIIPNQK